MKLYRIALRNISRNTRRSILSMVAIGVAAMTIVLMFSILAGFKHDIIHTLHTYYSGEIRIRHRDFDKMENLNPLHLNVQNISKLEQTLGEVEEIDMAVPRISFPSALYQEGETTGALAMGIDIEKEKVYQQLEDSLVNGTLPATGSNEALFSTGLLDKLDLNLGDKITIMVQTADRRSNALTVKITGIVHFPVAALNNNVYMLPIEKVQKSLRMNDAAVEYLVKLAPGQNSEEMAEKIQLLLDSGDYGDVTATSWTNINTSYSFVEMADTVYTIMAFLFFVLGSSVIINTTMMVIYERMKEIGTLSAMGMEGGKLIRLFFLEALFLGIAGSLVGVLLGVGIILPLQETGLDLSESMQGVSFEMSDIIYFKFTFRSTVLVFFYSSIIAALASLIPSRRAARIHPVKALRDYT